MWGGCEEVAKVQKKNKMLGVVMGYEGGLPRRNEGWESSKRVAGIYLCETFVQ